jgi:hypothetical protein
MPTEQILSPGVLAYENDQSYYSQGTTATGLAVVGPTQKGPAFVPTDITSYSQFIARFGSDTSTNYTAQTAYNYLQSGTTANITRVLGNGGYQYTSTRKLLAISSGSYILTVLYPTLNTSPNVGIAAGSTVAGTAAGFGANIYGDGTNGSFSASFSASLDPASSTYISKILGNAPNYQNASVFPYLLFDNFIANSASISTWTGSVSQSFTVSNCTFTSSNASGYDHASTPWVLSNSGQRLFKIHHISDGIATNTDIKVAISNITIGASVSTYSTFNVTVRSWNDTDKAPSIIEQFTNVSLDSTSPNYIGIVIGDKYSSYNSATGRVDNHGNYVNNSNYIRVEVSDGVANNAIQPQLIPNGHEAVYETIAGFSGKNLPAATIVSSNSSSYVYSGFDYSNTDNYNYLNPVPSEATSGLNSAFTKPSNDNKFILPFQGGTDGMNITTIKNTGANISSTNVFGFNLSTSTSAGALSYINALNMLANTELYKFSLLALPGVIEQYHGAVTSVAQSTVESRTDAVYIRDLTGINATVATAVSTAAAIDSSYCSAYYPWVLVRDLGSSRSIAVPPSVVVPQVYAYSDSVSAEWYAPAGLSRGVLGATDTTIRLSKSDRDVLYSGRVNPIAVFSNKVVIWGQKTLQVKDTALNRMNVRRLLINLREYISNVALNYVFENNTTTTRNKLVNAITPYMENVQARQGLYAFRVQIDDSLNTNDVIDRNQLVGKIFVSPTKSIEFILLEFNVTATGATFQ